MSAAVAAIFADAGFTNVRLSGADRYETAAAVAGEIRTLKGPAFSNKAFIARGDNFPDTLAVGPFAYSQSTPVLLT